MARDHDEHYAISHAIKATFPSWYADLLEEISSNIDFREPLFTGRGKKNRSPGSVVAFINEVALTDQEISPLIREKLKSVMIKKGKHWNFSSFYKDSYNLPIVKGEKDSLMKFELNVAPFLRQGYTVDQVRLMMQITFNKTKDWLGLRMPVPCERPKKEIKSTFHIRFYDMFEEISKNIDFSQSLFRGQKRNNSLSSVVALITEIALTDKEISPLMRAKLRSVMEDKGQAWAPIVYYFDAYNLMDINGDGQKCAAAFEIDQNLISAKNKNYPQIQQMLQSTYEQAKKQIGLPKLAMTAK